MTTASAEGRLGDLVVEFVKNTPRSEIHAGSPTAVITMMYEKGLKPQIDTLLDEMKIVLRRNRVEKLKRVINDKLSFVGCMARPKQPRRSKSTNIASEPIAQHV